MKRFRVLLLAFAAALLAQAPQDASQAEGTVLRISVTLVQVDAVVTDRAGRHVTDLLPDDFELRQDGKPQRITHFSFISTSPEVRPTVAGRPRNAPLIPPVPMRPAQVRRTIALVVDDIGLSFESTAYVRDALKKFVDEQMQPGDLVAIVRTGAGMGAFQQFTSDPRQLLAAVERVRWNPLGRGCVHTFAPLGSTPGVGPAEEDETRIPKEDIEELRTEYFAVGTLGALNFVVRGLKDLPGRKSVVLLSDSMPIFRKDGDSMRTLEQLRHLSDLANRSSVVIYTIDPRGLQSFALTAADNTRDMTAAQVGAAMEARRSDFFESQNGLHFLADQTGGLFMRDMNDVAAGLRRVVDDQSGYYLIGYQPDESTFAKSPGREIFHRISVRVKRPGLVVRSRRGFYGVPDREQRPVYRTREEQLTAALYSPFGTAAVRLRLTSLFMTDAKMQPVIYSMLHIDTRDLSFTEEADGWHKAVADVVVMTFGADGEQVDRSYRTYTIRLRGNTYKKALENGLLYVIHHPVKKAGAFQLRAAVRDTGSQKTGSANQFIEVPDVKKGRLTMSGIVVRSGLVVDKAVSEEGQAPEEGRSSPALRMFERGKPLAYAFHLFNVKLDSKTKKPNVATQVRLFRDGKPVFVGKENAVPLESGDPKRVLLGGRIHLGSALDPGGYVLQVVATDRLAKEKYRTASQWIDFEVEK